MKTIDELDVANLRVLVRADLNGEALPGLAVLQDTAGTPA